MNKRTLVALVALAGAFVALYLTLYKLGYIGVLVCAVGSCEKVQTSRWATFLGLPVGGWGVGYYVAVFVIALAGLRSPFSEHLGFSQGLTALTGFGLLFSLWLTYLELFVIHAICQWCVISALLATALFVLSWLDMRDVKRWAEALAEDSAATLKGAGYGQSLRNTAEVSVRATKD